MDGTNSIVVGVSGASGSVAGLEVLRSLRAAGRETHVVVTEAARRTMDIECPGGAAELEKMACVLYDPADSAAAIASGSFRCAGMIVAPCSMKTVAGIVCGYADNLLLRAADVTLKERRPLVLLPRECPLSSLHLRNLAAVSEIGARVYPLMMGFYQRPQTIDDMVRALVARALTVFGVETGGQELWTGV